ncbi:aspartoacylase [Vibrio sonorensis]|uniref:aspartoacylase n=1 Tax=Vibrio sonorensis TaxID=1004316 RepID=UPI0008DA187C|nr:aspartoacylase [Vibrio sonorensis]
MINHVVLVSGTHGNELTGIYLNELIQQGLFSIERESFTSHRLIANPEAIAKGVRFIDNDLNRLFSDSNKPELSSDSYEASRAERIKGWYGDRKHHFVIDIHNTTSNMGTTFILLEQSSFYRKLAGYIKQAIPNANILFEDQVSWEEHPYLCTVAPAGIMIEMGGHAHGVLQLDVLEATRNAVAATLDFIQAYNSEALPTLPENIPAYRLLEEVSFPVNHENKRLATVHPTLLGRDFLPLELGEPLFSYFDGRDTYFDGSSTVYPHFINEAAYATSHIAMALAEKFTFNPND